MGIPFFDAPSQVRVDTSRPRLRPPTSVHLLLLFYLYFSSSTHLSLPLSFLAPIRAFTAVLFVMLASKLVHRRSKNRHSEAHDLYFRQLTSVARRQVRFSGDQGKIVDDVLEGRADFGFVRADFLKKKDDDVRLILSHFAARAPSFAMSLACPTWHDLTDTWQAKRMMRCRRANHSRC